MRKLQAPCAAQQRRLSMGAAAAGEVPRREARVPRSTRSMARQLVECLGTEFQGRLYFNVFGRVEQRQSVATAACAGWLPFYLLCVECVCLQTAPPPPPTTCMWPACM